MARITYDFETGGHHNNIVIEPLISDLMLFSIYIIDNNNTRQNILKSPISLNSKKIFRYDHTVSRNVQLVIGHPTSDSISFGTDIKINTSLQKFTGDGDFSTKNHRAKIGSKLYLYSKISNESTYAIMAELSINIIDMAGNVIDSAVAKIPLNDDRIIASYADKNFIYPAQDVAVFWNDEKVDKSFFNIKEDGIEIKNASDTVMLYKPNFSSMDLSQTIKIDKNFNIHIDNPLGAYIDYAVRVKLFNTKIKNTNSTPIINQLALVVKE